MHHVAGPDLTSLKDSKAPSSEDDSLNKGNDEWEENVTPHMRVSDSHFSWGTTTTQSKEVMSPFHDATGQYRNVLVLHCTPGLRFASDDMISRPMFAAFKPVPVRSTYLSTLG